VIEAGDVYVADFRDERRRLALVLSNVHFHRVSGQVIVAPQIDGEPDEVMLPWRIDFAGNVFAVDRIRSMHADRLLDRLDRAPLSIVAAARRAVRSIT
jgi:mRNA-degrading endonuclease toxin of MazEF toxin-antitoxin module